MNIVKQNYHPVMGTTMTKNQMEEYYENYFSKGGIASLTRPFHQNQGQHLMGCLMYIIMLRRYRSNKWQI